MRCLHKLGMYSHTSHKQKQHVSFILLPLKAYNYSTHLSKIQVLAEFEASIFDEVRIGQVLKNLAGWKVNFFG